MTPSVALRLGRVSNLPTVWSNTLAGAALAGGMNGAAPLGAIAAAAVCASAFYVGGMFLNDAFDREIDAGERPERPIPSGQVAAGTVFAYGFGLLAAGIAGAAFCAVAVGAQALPAIAAGTALAAAVIAYDFAHKGFAFAPAVMGVCRALVYVLAAVATGGEAGHAVWLGGAALAAYVAGLTYLAAQENLREVGNLWPLLLVAAPVAGLAACGRLEGTSVAFALALVGWAAYAISFAAREANRDVPGAVTRLIAGVALVDALAIAAAGFAVPALAAAAALPLTRLFQRSIPGT